MCSPVNRICGASQVIAGRASNQQVANYAERCGLCAHLLKGGQVADVVICVVGCGCPAIFNTYTYTLTHKDMHT